MLREEDHAQVAAARLGEAARLGNAEELSLAVAGIERLLEHELDAHLAFEETDLFPVLAARGLAPEVDAALSSTSCVDDAQQLLRARARDAEGMRACLEGLALHLKQHIQFEADFLYVDSMTAEADAFRDDVDAALEKDAG